MEIICQVLGHICYHILAAGLNGYMATVTNLKSPVNKWKCGAAPITVEFHLLRFILKWPLYSFSLFFPLVYNLFRRWWRWSIGPRMLVLLQLQLVDLQFIQLWWIWKAKHTSKHPFFFSQKKKEHEQHLLNSLPQVFSQLFLQPFETERGEILDGGSVQKPRTASVWWSWCWCQSSESLRWRSRLHGPYQEAAGISRPGNKTYFGFLSFVFFCSYINCEHFVVAQVRTLVKPGCSQDVLKAALSVMASVTDVLTTISSSSNNGQQYA